MASTSNGRSDDCVSILSLSDSDTYSKLRADDREIEEAAEIARNGGLDNFWKTGQYRHI